MLNSALLTEEALFQPVEVMGRVVGVLENETFIPIKADFRNSYLEDENGVRNISSPYGDRLTKSKSYGEYDYAVRAYKANPVFGKTGVAYRVSRKRHQGNNTNGYGLEYLDTKGKWHQQKSLKPRNILIIIMKQQLTHIFNIKGVCDGCYSNR